MSHIPFIWVSEQKVDDDVTFRSLVSQGPKLRDDGQNRWYLFRKEININDDIHSAITKVTVDGRYQLFVNQQRVARGPIRCNPNFQRYDEIDIAPYLKKGTTVIGMLVHVYGKDTAWYQKSQDYWQSIFGDGALFFESTMHSISKEKSFVLSSDCSWKCKILDAWDSDTPPSGWGQGFIEKYDASKFPVQWLDESFDDSDWTNAVEQAYETSQNEKKMGWQNIHPFPVLVKNDLEQLTEFNVYPEKVLSVFNVIPEPELEFHQRLYEEKYSEITLSKNEKANYQKMLSDDEQFTVIQANNEIAIMIKFDKLYTGYPFIELNAEGGEIVDIAVSETLPGEFTQGGISENRLRIGSHLDCKHLFQYKARPGQQRFEKFEWTAVRYLQIVVRNVSSEISIKKVGVNATHYPLENRGHFHCSDKFLDKLWDIGRYTTLLCSHDAWEDCPSREKRQWVGDGLIHYPVGQVCFGESGIALDRLYLHQSAESQRNDGLLQMFAPGDHHYHGIVIPDFSLHWISTLYHYLWTTNDRETVEYLFPVAQKILQWFYFQLNEHGMLENMPHWHFIEWANIGRNDQATPLNALFAGTLKHAIFIADYLGYQTTKMDSICNTIMMTLNKEHWDPERKIYIDSIDPNNNKKSRQVSQHANSMMVYYELAPEHRWASMMDYITDSKRTKITATPPVVNFGEELDEEYDVVKCNTYYSHFLYGALVKVQQFDKALNIIRDNYSPMIESGTTTLWESFSPDASLCHAFSASPVFYLSSEILGVKATVPGFKKIIISPQFCDLSSASGCYPTKWGNIRVSWKKTKALLEIEVTIPETVVVSLQLPSEYCQSEDLIELQTGAQQLEFTSSK